MIGEHKFAQLTNEQQDIFLSAVESANKEIFSWRGQVKCWLIVFLAMISLPIPSIFFYHAFWSQFSWWTTPMEGFEVGLLIGNWILGWALSLIIAGYIGKLLK
jgi:hypothetical protein